MTNFVSVISFIFYNCAINDLELTRWFCMTRQSVFNFLSKSGGNLQKENISSYNVIAETTKRAQ
jgi:hypothetical protein